MLLALSKFTQSSFMSAGADVTHPYPSSHQHEDDIIIQIKHVKFQFTPLGSGCL